MENNSDIIWLRSHLREINQTRSIMWPYHLSRLFLRIIAIGSMLASLQMSSFLMWSFLVLPLVHLTILISVVCSLCVIGSMLASLQMSSFLMWSFLVLPLVHLTILISVVCTFCVSFFLTAQHSEKINHSSVSPRRDSLEGI